MIVELLISLVLLVIAAKFLGFFGKKSKSKNPFHEDTRRPVQPLVVDQDKRDKVLKNGYTKKKVPENLDAIVIGSGIGGLSTAALMAKAGKKVLVLEQHDQAGGCCHTFIDKGFEFDVGIHYIGEIRNRTSIRYLLEQLTDGQLVWAPLKDVYENVILGDPKKGTMKSYPVSSGSREKYVNGLKTLFPKEHAAIDAFVDLVDQVRQEVKGFVMLKFMPSWICNILVKTGLVHRRTNYFKLASRTLSEVLAELTQNEELRAVLAYNFGDYGTLPCNTSFVMHASLIAHFLFGVSYPRGGASEIAFHIIPVIERPGGSVLVRAPVESIILDQSNTAIGVRVSRSSGETDEIFAPLIISDAGIFNTYQTLIPAQAQANSTIQRTLSHAQHGVGAMTIYIGLDGSQEELGLPGLNLWAFFNGTDLDGDCTKYVNGSLDDALQEATNVPLLFISFPSTKDPTWNDRFPGKTTCEIVTFAPWSWFEQWEHERVKKRGDDYQSLKDQLARKAWNQVVQIYPFLEDKVAYFEAGSPLTNKYYIGAPKGEIYGIDHNLFVAFLSNGFTVMIFRSRFSPESAAAFRPETPIKNLLLTGQDIFTGGFCGAMFGGLLSASTALGRNLYVDLLKARAKFTPK